VVDFGLRQTCDDFASDETVPNDVRSPIKFKNGLTSSGTPLASRSDRFWNCRHVCNRVPNEEREFASEALPQDSTLCATSALE
jgi:hypothetical protein